MLESVKHLFQKLWFLSFILAVTLFFVNIDTFITYWQAPFILGWDGAGHQAAGELYAKNIFPSFSGWIPEWYSGMPFPQFYPPLFYFLLAILSKLLFFLDYLTVFKLFVFFLTLVTPGLIVWLSDKFMPTRTTATRWLLGIISIFYISSYGQQGNYGFTIESTFNVSFVTQLLAFVCCILWIGFFIEAERSRKNSILASIFLLAVLLSNVHIVPIAMATGFTILIYKIWLFTRKEIDTTGLRRILLSLVLAALGCLFWYVPLFENFRFFSTKALSLNEAMIDQILWIPLLYVIPFAFLLGIVKKDYKFLAFSAGAIIVALAIILRIDEKLPFLPLHLARWMAWMFISSIICTAYLFNNLSLIFKKSSFLYATFFIFAIYPFCLLYYAGMPLKNHEGWFTEYRANGGDKILEYMKDHPDATVVEASYMAKEPESFVLDALLGKEGVPTATFTLRESSISSEYLTSIRNTFSQNPELWGITSYLANDRTFIRQPTDIQIDRVAFAGYRYLLVRSIWAIDRLSHSDKVILEKDFGIWKLFRLKSTDPFATISEPKPIALYANVDFKNRPDTYDFSRFGEEVIYQNLEREISFVHPPTLEDEDLSKFPIIVMGEYEFNDEKKDLALLDAYSREHQLILIPDKKRKLFNDLSLLNDKDHHITIVSLKNAYNFSKETRGTIHQVLFLIQDLQKKSLDQVNMATIQNPPMILSSVRSAENIDILFSATSSLPLPVLIRQSYFPDWKRKDGAPVYLASPSYSITYATSSFSLSFKKSSLRNIGEGLSLLGLIGLLFI